MAKVIRAFTDRVTGEVYLPGAEYAGERTDELAAAGVIEKPAPKPKAKRKKKE